MGKKSKKTNTMPRASNGKFAKTPKLEALVPTTIPTLVQSEPNRTDKPETESVFFGEIMSKKNEVSVALVVAIALTAMFVAPVLTIVLLGVLVALHREVVTDSLTQLGGWLKNTVWVKINAAIEKVVDYFSGL